MEPTRLPASPIEVVYAIALVVAVIFAAYAIRRTARREWPVGFALTLILFTFIVPFSGPVVVGLRTLWRRRAVASSSGRA